jgi:2-succinyl-6-hydroxy-2,4-cyclohexadiene-1-carboxylate synthase
MMWRVQTLVFLHGFTQTRQSWRRTVRALGQAKYRALVPDLPGHGQACHRTASFDACTAYVRALAESHPRVPAGGPRPPDAPEELAAASPSGRCVLVGYSMGGRIALHAALSLKPERLVLIGASPGLADAAERAARRAADDALADRIEEIGVEAFAAEWGELPLFAGQPERVRAAANADRLRNTPFGLANALRGLGTGVMEPLWERLGELTMPVALVVGERDEKFRATAERMRERLPDAQLQVIPATGHAPQLEDPEAVARVISELARRDAPSGPRR